MGHFISSGTVFIRNKYLRFMPSPCSPHTYHFHCLSLQKGSKSQGNQFTPLLAIFVCVLIKQSQNSGTSYLWGRISQQSQVLFITEKSDIHPRLTSSKSYVLISVNVNSFERLFKKVFHLYSWS